MDLILWEMEHGDAAVVEHRQRLRFRRSRGAGGGAAASPPRTRKNKIDTDVIIKIYKQRHADAGSCYCDHRIETIYLVRKSPEKLAIFVCSGGGGGGGGGSEDPTTNTTRNVNQLMRYIENDQYIHRQIDMSNQYSSSPTGVRSHRKANRPELCLYDPMDRDIYLEVKRSWGCASAGGQLMGARAWPYRSDSCSVARLSMSAKYSTSCPLESRHELHKERRRRIQGQAGRLLGRGRHLNG